MAKTVTFAPEIQRKTVTLDGDVFDPAGTLTGGSAPQGIPILKLLHELNDLQRQHAEHSQLLAECQARLADLRTKKEAWSQNANQLSLALHKVELLKQRLEQSPYHQLVAKLERFTTEIQEWQQKSNDMSAKEAEANALLNELQSQQSDLESQRRAQAKKSAVRTCFGCRE